MVTHPLSWHMLSFPHPYSIIPSRFHKFELIICVYISMTMSALSQLSLQHSVCISFLHNFLLFLELMVSFSLYFCIVLHLFYHSWKPKSFPELQNPFSMVKTPWNLLIPSPSIPLESSILQAGLSCSAGTGDCPSPSSWEFLHFAVWDP